MEAQSGPRTLTNGGVWRLEMAMKSPEVVNSHRFDDEQDPDPHKNENEGSGAKVMRVRNTDCRDAMDQDLHCFVQ